MTSHLWTCVCLSASHFQQNQVWLGRPPSSPTSLWEADFCVEIAHDPSDTSNVHNEPSCPVALEQNGCAPQGIFDNGWRHLRVVHLRGGGSCSQCGEPRDAAKHPISHKAAPNSKALSCSQCQQCHKEAKRRFTFRYQNCSLGATNCQIFVMSCDSSQSPLPAQQAPQAWPSHLIGWLRWILSS